MRVVHQASRERDLGPLALREALGVSIGKLVDFEQLDNFGDAIVDALGEIYAQIAAHFALEEKYMRETRYMAYAEHKEDHEILLDDLRDIMDQVEDDGTYDEKRLSKDLSFWFSEHFRTHDAQLHGRL